MKRIACWAAVAAIVAIAAACGGPTAPANSGTLTVLLKDSPYSDAKALLVTFSEVSVHMSGGAWVTVPFANATSRTCDLKKLATAQDVLGTGPLAAGHYTEIRLTVASSSLYFDNASSGAACAATIPTPAGRNASVEIPSGIIRLNREFDVANAQTTTILLDFDGDKSVTQTGNGTYRMTPVIEIVSVQ